MTISFVVSLVSWFRVFRGFASFVVSKIKKPTLFVRRLMFARVVVV